MLVSQKPIARIASCIYAALLYGTHTHFPALRNMEAAFVDRHCCGSGRSCRLCRGEYAPREVAQTSHSQLAYGAGRGGGSREHVRVWRSEWSSVLAHFVPVQLQREWHRSFG